MSNDAKFTIGMVTVSVVSNRLVKRFAPACYSRSGTIKSGAFMLTMIGVTAALKQIDSK